ncbi:glycosyltransferase [Chitinibacter sp. FCG-7]|uniref:Glycosyltransferase n=1 Tax=Chitinibacter mangrovi TaxID=3153927 RepID=A0AAU7F691_9NEIS
MSTNFKICIGVPTFKRKESLEELMDSLNNLSFNYLPIDVFVADNDSVQQMGVKTIASMSTSLTNLKVSTSVVLGKGISAVRNRIMEFAFFENDFDFLVMIDDDEFVDSSWLVELMNTQKTYNADVVGAHILPDFTHVKKKSWMEHLNIYFDSPRQDGATDLIEASGAVLLSRNFFRKNPTLQFDLEFGLTGGEDKDFFIRAKKLGCTFAYARNAICYEAIPLARATIQWAFWRSYRIGSCDARISIKYSSKPNVQKVKIIAYSTFAVCANIILLIGDLLNPSRMPKRLCSIARQLGKVSSVFRLNKKFYGGDVC